MKKFLFVLVLTFIAGTSVAAQGVNVPEEWRDRVYSIRQTGFALIDEPHNEWIIKKFYSQVKVDSGLASRTEGFAQRARGVRIVSIRYVANFTAICMESDLVTIKAIENVRLEFADGWELKASNNLRTFVFVKDARRGWLLESAHSDQDSFVP